MQASQPLQGFALLLGAHAVTRDQSQLRAVLEEHVASRLLRVDAHAICSSAGTGEVQWGFTCADLAEGRGSGAGTWSLDIGMARALRAAAPPAHPPFVMMALVAAGTLNCRHRAAADSWGSSCAPMEWEEGRGGRPAGEGKEALARAWQAQQQPHLLTGKLEHCCEGRILRDAEDAEGQLGVCIARREQAEQRFQSRR